jgi:hypothetical protein
MLAAVVGYGRLLAFSEKDPEWPAMAGNNALTTIDTLQFAGRSRCRSTRMAL